jgi:hypothetical protein
MLELWRIKIFSEGLSLKDFLSTIILGSRSTHGIYESIERENLPEPMAILQFISVINFFVE